jgi:hypothetical protein
MSGYSGTPLPKKLGIKPSSRLCIVDPPDGLYALLDPLPDDVEIVEGTGGRAEVAVVFVTRADDLVAWLARIEPTVERGDRLWIAWPKKASKVPTDLAHEIVQGEGLALGLVDTKVCAISETWSGLCFMRRRDAGEKRGAS